MNKAQTEKLAKSLSIKLSSPGKMPGFTFALPAQACITGSKLRKVEGSVCSKCYACKGHYCFGATKALREHNLDAVRQSGQWVSDLIRFLQESGQPQFRFHDSGDLQSLGHLNQIVAVARAVPGCKFWLPTKEYAIVNSYLRGTPEGFPSNLCVRVSMPMIGQAPKSYNGLPTATVNSDCDTFNCPVKNGLEGCDTYNCRKCWDKGEANINYHKH
jgi:hypothetical protein